MSKNSLSMQLLARVFSVYVLITLALTLTHMVAEYINTQKMVLLELEGLGRSFKPGLATAIWAEDEIQVRSIAQGMMENPVLEKMVIRPLWGVATQEISLSASLSKDSINSPQSNTASSSATSTAWQEALFGRSFPIVYNNQGQNKQVGEIELFSSHFNLITKVQYGFSFIIINAIIKTIALWSIFLWFSRSLLLLPLRQLTDATQQLHLNTLENLHVSVSTKGYNELKVLEIAFNSMIQKLLRAWQELSQASADLQKANQRLSLLLKSQLEISTLRDSFTVMIKTAYTFARKFSESGQALLEIYFLETNTVGNDGFAYFKLKVDANRETQPLIKLEGCTILAHAQVKNPPYEFELNGNNLILQHNMLILPMFTNQKMLGLLQMHVPDGYALSVEDKTFADTFGHFLAVSIENIRFNLELEQKIWRRTRELKEAHERLQGQHLRLQQAQMQLVHSEKMAGLGTLVAGVAHEVNNPLNFITGLLFNIKTTMERLKLDLLEITDEDDVESRSFINNYFSDLDELVRGANVGVKRIQTIIMDLRAFSRLDEAHLKKINLEDNLHSVLRLAKAQYQEKVEFIDDFKVAAELECWPAELNQAFMNILTNAGYAVLQQSAIMGDSYKAQVSITTFIENQHVGVQFRDNGCGMSEEEQRKIFEPFFTTKPVGKGTGMGMAVVFGIIQKHRGQISVQSQLGQGSTITLKFPLEAHLQ